MSAKEGEKREMEGEPHETRESATMESQRAGFGERRVSMATEPPRCHRKCVQVSPPSLFRFPFSNKMAGIIHIRCESKTVTFIVCVCVRAFGGRGRGATARSCP